MKMQNELSSIDERHRMTLDALSVLKLKPKSPYYESTQEMAFHCPFHVDKTPSMYINLMDGKYNCFSCGRGGYIEGLYRDLTGGNLKKDFGYLTDRFISYAKPTNYYTWDYNPVEDQEKKIDQTYVHFDPTDIVDALTVPDCKAYIQKRGISEDIAKQLNFKFAADTRINTTTFKNRLLIPIKEKGHLVSIEGRRIYDTEEVKVLYPKNCSVNTLFDIDNLNKTKPVYACEGLMDLCVLRSSGSFPNSTSIFGANLTARQTSLISEFDKFIYIPDLDAAGCKTMEALQKTGAQNIWYLLLPPVVGGIHIKDIGDIPKTGYSINDLVNRKWLNYIKPIKQFNPKFFMSYVNGEFN